LLSSIGQAFGGSGGGRSGGGGRRTAEDFGFGDRSRSGGFFGGSTRRTTSPGFSGQSGFNIGSGGLRL
jgi:hypothetical protein